MSLGPADRAAVDAEWRGLVFPAGWRNPTPSGRYNLIVIGAGPGGLVTAIAAAGLGAKVALIERHAMGGDCLNVGCVPSKALLAAAARGMSSEDALAHAHRIRRDIAQHDSVERYTRAGVDVYLGAARFEDPRRVRVGETLLEARRIVIASGARAALPPIPGLDAAGARTNENIFELERAPRRLAILGAGAIGCELAQAFRALGSEVELIEAAPRILSLEDEEPARLVQRALEAAGIRLHCGARVERVERDGDLRRLHLAGGARIEADELLVAAGRARNVEGLGLERAGVAFDARTGIRVDERLRTTQRGIYAIGDVSSTLQFTHTADAQARIVIRNALFAGRARVDRLAIPRCIYTKPELARIGASRAELDSQGRAYDAFRFAFGDLDRGRTDFGDDGFAEVLTARGSDRLLGATIVGRDAGEQLAPLAVLMTSGQGLGALGSLVLPYPTRSEYLRRLVDAWNRTRLTPRTARLLGAWLRWTRR